MILKLVDGKIYNIPHGASGVSGLLNTLLDNATENPENPEVIFNMPYISGDFEDIAELLMHDKIPEPAEITDAFLTSLGCNRLG